MKCADPVLCYNAPDGKRHWRHFSLASKIFIEHLHDQVFDCGKCLFCRKKKAYELACRCVLHASLYNENCFLTLTYDEKKEGYHNVLDYSDIQRFKKRLRSYVSRNFNGRKIEIFNVHEYGKNRKKHWHLVVFGFDFEDKEIFTYKNGIPLFKSKRLQSLWNAGFGSIGDVTEASAMYQAQYMEKDFKNHFGASQFRSKSQHSGIGKKYFLNHYRQILRLGFIPINGRRLPVPRYFERLADKHRCHFYEKSAFIDTARRKAKYRPFKENEAKKEIADLFVDYLKMKEARLPEIEKEWSDVVSKYLTEGLEPDFIKSCRNALYDLRKKNKKETF